MIRARSCGAQCRTDADMGVDGRYSTVRCDWGKQQPFTLQRLEAAQEGRRTSVSGRRTSSTFLHSHLAMIPAGSKSGSVLLPGALGHGIHTRPAGYAFSSSGYEDMPMASAQTSS